MSVWFYAPLVVVFTALAAALALDEQQHRRRQRPHVHSFRLVKEVHSGPTLAARIFGCECGEERREMTPAGMQQYGWWRDLGATHDEATGHVYAGEYPAIDLLATGGSERSEA